MEDKELMKDWAVMFLSFWKICQHFGLDEEGMRKIDAADKILDRVRNLETFMLISKAKDNKETV